MGTDYYILTYMSPWHNLYKVDVIEILEPEPGIFPSQIELFDGSSQIINFTVANDNPS